jgi:hypothetical protein
MSTDYAVVTEKFAERHFIKYFEKKYKGAWDITWTSIEEEFKRFDSLLETSIAETIISGQTAGKQIKICKTEFRVAGTKESRHGSGNRCIVAVHVDALTVHVLLVYCKTDLASSNETAQWKLIIRDNYPEYRPLL